MNWLFYVVIVFLLICMFRGARKGFVRTAVSMVFMILVLYLASWMNPYVGQFLRDSTPVYNVIYEQSNKVITTQLFGTQEDSVVETADNKEESMPQSLQTQMIEGAPIPQSWKQSLLQNNNSEIYKTLGVDKFSDYLAGYLAYSITNGIGFLLSFVLATIIIKVILYAVDLLAKLPGISLLNTTGGLLLGIGQGILWVWVFFIIVTVLYNTQLGQVLMKAIEADAVLSFLYDKNVLLQVILSIVSGT